jgi:hypothetical protein
MIHALLYNKNQQVIINYYSSWYQVLISIQGDMGYEPTTLSGGAEIYYNIHLVHETI